MEVVWDGKQGASPPDADSVLAGRRPRLVLTTSVPGSPADGSAQVAQRLIHGDNRKVLRAIQAELRGRVDLIYIDPPFNLGSDLTLEVPSGSGSFKVPAYRDRWGCGARSYAQMMYDRLALMRDLLSETGSIYVHCDYRVNALLRMILDELFGADRLCNEIIWHYQSGGRQRERFSMKHDTLFLYTRSDRWTFNLGAIARPRGTARRNHMKRQTAPDGRTCFTIKSAGKVYTYFEDDLLTPSDVWTDISHIQQKDPQRCGYPSQKPEALLERIILASSNEGDLVADFFCGSGTTGVVAERLRRRWILCDQSRTAILASMKRLVDAQRSRAPAGHPAAGFDLYTAEPAETSHGEELYVQAGRTEDGMVNLRLTGYKPNLEDWPEETQPLIGARTASGNLELIEFWAIDFDWRPGRAFRCGWQAFRTRARPMLDMECRAAGADPGGGGFICVQAFDALGRESRAIIPWSDLQSSDENRDCRVQS